MIGYYTSHDLVSPKIDELEIISTNLFMQTQKILDQRAVKNEEKREISRNTTGKTLLSGNVYCKACGSWIVSTSYTDRYVKTNGNLSETKMYRYLCYHRSRKLNNCNGQGTYIAEKVDNAVIQTVRKMFSQIKEQPETVAIEHKLQIQSQSMKQARKKVLIELEKHNKQLEKLQFEIADSLTGDSIYTAEDLAQAIKTLKAKITANEQKLAEMEVEIEQQSNSLSAIGLMYDSFLGWANEFDNAALEQQKMIIGQLIKRVELERGYKVHIEFNMDYEQFCTDWSRETSTNTMTLCCG